MSVVVYVAQEGVYCHGLLFVVLFISFDAVVGLLHDVVLLLVSVFVGCGVITTIQIWVGFVFCCFCCALTLNCLVG